MQNTELTVTLGLRVLSSTIHVKNVHLRNQVEWMTQEAQRHINGSTG